MFYEATKPEYVFAKLNECKFFLGLMGEYRQKIETERQQRLPAEFLYYISAYLSAFRSTAYRLIDVVRHRDASKGRALGRQLRSHSDIECIRDISNLEMHGDGVVIWPRFKIVLPPSAPEPRSRYGSRFGGRYNRWNEAGVIVQVIDWRFSTRPENLVDLCDRALGELEKLVSQSVV